MDIMTFVFFAAEAAPSKAPNLWGALGCALAYSGALFATVDAFADAILTQGDRPDGRSSPGLRLKFGSKIAAAAITVVAAGLVLAIDDNWFAFTLLSVTFIVLVALSALVFVRQRALWRRFDGDAVGSIHSSEPPRSV